MTVRHLFGRIQRVVISAGTIRVTLTDTRNNKRPIEIPWASKPKGELQVQFASPKTKADPKLLKAIVRARGWLCQLTGVVITSIENLAAAAGYNPKVIRQGLRLAFLAPEIATAALHGDTPIRLKQIPKVLSLSWRGQLEAIS